jgi:hypothetical protein
MIAWKRPLGVGFLVVGALGEIAVRADYGREHVSWHTTVYAILGGAALIAGAALLVAARRTKP